MEKAIKRYFPIFLIPTLLAYFIAFVLPFFMGVFLSFTKFTTVTYFKIVGIRNYVLAFKDGDFVHSLIFTIEFTIVAVITINLLGFLFALLLTKGIPGTTFFRTIFFMPNLIGGIVLGYIWQLIINGVLYRFNFTLVYDPKYGFWGLVLLMNWQLIGYMMVIYIAGIQGISRELMEAAKVDGATSFQVLRKITIPLVRPSITICTFLTLTNSFRLFDQNLALTGGDPAKQTEMLALNIYNTFYSRVGWEGVGQAKAVVFFVIVSVLVITQLVLTRRKEVEN